MYWDCRRLGADNHSQKSRTPLIRSSATKRCSCRNGKGPTTKATNTKCYHEVSSWWRSTNALRNSSSCCNGHARGSSSGLPTIGVTISPRSQRQRRQWWQWISSGMDGTIPATAARQWDSKRSLVPTSVRCWTSRQKYVCVVLFLYRYSCPHSSRVQWLPTYECFSVPGYELLVCVGRFIRQWFILLTNSPGDNSVFLPCWFFACTYNRFCLQKVGHLILYLGVDFIPVLSKLIGVCVGGMIWGLSQQHESPIREGDKETPILLCNSKIFVISHCLSEVSLTRVVAARGHFDIFRHSV